MRRLPVLILIVGLCRVAPTFGYGQTGDTTQQQGQGHTSYLGLGLVDVDATRARALHMETPHGTEVTRVDDGSPAEKAGLHPGDVLLAYNGESVLGGQQLARLVHETPPGRRVTLGYWRGGRNLTASVLVAIRPANLEAPPDSWSPGMPDTHGLSSPMEIPFPLLIWRNMLLGIECETMQSPLADYFGVSRGVLVRAVQHGSVADAAGLHAGDVIVGIAEHGVRSPRELTAILRLEWVPGRTLRLQLYRDRKRASADLTVPEEAQ